MARQIGLTDASSALVVVAEKSAALLRKATVDALKPQAAAAIIATEASQVCGVIFSPFPCHCDRQLHAGGCMGWAHSRALAPQLHA